MPNYPGLVEGRTLTPGFVSVRIYLDIWLKENEEMFTFAIYPSPLQDNPPIPPSYPAVHPNIQPCCKPS